MLVNFQRTPGGRRHLYRVTGISPDGTLRAYGPVIEVEGSAQPVGKAKEINIDQGHRWKHYDPTDPDSVACDRCGIPPYEAGKPCRP